MERLTRSLDNNEFYIVSNDKVNHDEKGYFGDAINKLAKFENIYDDLLRNQSEIINDMERLRNEGKTNTVSFKELMIKKITNNNTLTIFKMYGLQ